MKENIIDLKQLQTEIENEEITTVDLSQKSIITNEINSESSPNKYAWLPKTKFTNARPVSARLLSSGLLLITIGETSRSNQPIPLELKLLEIPTESYVKSLNVQSIPLILKDENIAVLTDTGNVIFFDNEGREIKVFDWGNKESEEKKNFSKAQELLLLSQERVAVLGVNTQSYSGNYWIKILNHQGDSLKSLESNFLSLEIIKNSKIKGFNLSRGLFAAVVQRSLDYSTAQYYWAGIWDQSGNSVMPIPQWPESVYGQKSIWDQQSGKFVQKKIFPAIKDLFLLPDKKIALISQLPYIERTNIEVDPDPYEHCHLESVCYFDAGGKFIGYEAFRNQAFNPQDILWRIEKNLISWKPLFNPISNIKILVPKPIKYDGMTLTDYFGEYYFNNYCYWIDDKILIIYGDIYEVQKENRQSPEKKIVHVKKMLPGIGTGTQFLSKQQFVCGNKIYNIINDEVKTFMKLQVHNIGTSVILSPKYIALSIHNEIYNDYSQAKVWDTSDKYMRYQYKKMCF